MCARFALCCVLLWFRTGRFYLHFSWEYPCHWGSHTMMTSSSGSIFRVTDPLFGEFTGTGEFPTQRSVTRSFDVFFDLRLNERLSKQPWGWSFEMLSWSLWRHCNAVVSMPMKHHWIIWARSCRQLRLLCPQDSRNLPRTTLLIGFHSCCGALKSTD